MTKQRREAIRLAFEHARSPLAREMGIALAVHVDDADLDELEILADAAIEHSKPEEQAAQSLRVLTWVWQNTGKLTAQPTAESASKARHALVLASYLGTGKAIRINPHDALHLFREIAHPDGERQRIAQAAAARARVRAETTHWHVRVSGPHVWWVLGYPSRPFTRDEAEELCWSWSKWCSKWCSGGEWLDEPVECRGEHCGEPGHSSTRP